MIIPYISSNCLCVVCTTDCWQSQTLLCNYFNEFFAGLLL